MYGIGGELGVSWIIWCYDLVGRDSKIRSMLRALRTVGR
jgi:hypothetical protein